jgi:hypothetical protein
MLLEALQSAGDQRIEYWRNRIAPYLNDVWPKNTGVMSEAISQIFAELAIAAGGAFPEAQTAIHSWVGPLAYPHSVTEDLAKSDLCRRFPREALALLEAIISKAPPILPKDLVVCLNEISRIQPALQQDPRFRRLQDLARQFGLIEV